MGATLPARPSLPLALGGLLALLLAACAVAAKPIAGAALVLVLPAAAFAWRRPALAALALVTLVPITSGLARGVPIPGLRLSELLTVGGATLLLLAADHRTDTRWLLLDRLAFAYVVAHLGIGIVWSRLHGQALGSEALGVLIGPAQFFLFYRALVLTLQTPQRRALALRCLLLASLPVSLLAIGQAALPPVDALLTGLTGYVQQTGETISTLRRVTGPFPHFQVLSVYLCAVVIVGGATIVDDEARRILRRGPLVAVLLSAGVALLLTVTITTMLAALVALLLMMARQRRRLLVPALACVALLVVAFSPLLAQRVHDQTTVAAGTQSGQRNPLIPETVAFRWEIWTKQSIPVVRENAQLGTGPTISDTVAWRATESMYFTQLFRGGVPLLALWVAMMAGLIVAARRLRDAADPGVRIAARALFLLSACLMVMQIVQPYLTYGGISYVLWTLAAIVTVGGLRRAPVRSDGFRLGPEVAAALAAPGFAPPVGFVSPVPRSRAPRPRLRLPARLRRTGGRDWRAVATLIVAEGGSRALGFAFYLVAARALAPAGFGEVRYTIALSSIAFGVTQILMLALLRELGAARDDAARTQRVLSTACTLAGVLLAGSMLLCAGAAAAGVTGSAQLLPLLVVLLGRVVFELYYAIARGLGAVGRATAAYAGGSAFQLVVFCALALTIAPGAALTLIVFGVSSIVPVLLLEAWRPVLRQARVSVDRTVARSLWLVGAPLIGAQLGYLVWNSADQVWVENVLGVTQVGLYGAARNLVQLFIIVPAGVGGVLLPRVAQLRSQGDDAGAQRLLHQALAVTAGLSCALAAVFVALRADLVVWLYGSDYAAAAPLLPPLSLAMVAFAVLITYTNAAVGWGRPRLYAGAIATAAVLELAVLLLGPDPTALLAAWALAFSAMAALICIVLWLRFKPFTGPRAPRAPGDGDADGTPAGAAADRPLARSPR